MKTKKVALIVANSRAEFGGLFQLAKDISDEFIIDIYLPELEFDNEINDLINGYGLEFRYLVDKYYRIHDKKPEESSESMDEVLYSLKVVQGIKFLYRGSLRRGIMTLRFLFLFFPAVFLKILLSTLNLLARLSSSDTLKKWEELLDDSVNRLKQKRVDRRLKVKKTSRKTRVSRLIRTDYSLLSFSFVYALILIEYYLKTSSMMDKLRVDLVIGGEGSVPYKIKYVSKYCQSRRIPVVVFPYTVANWREYFEAYKDEEPYQINNIIGRAMYRLDRDLIYQKGDKWVSRIPVYFYFGYKVLGLIPKPAWIMNSIPLKKVLVESTFIYDYLKNGGLPESRIKVVGSSQLDELYLDDDERAYRKNKLLDSLGEKDKGRVLLCCPPPYQGGRETVDFENYSSFLHSFLKDIKEEFKSWNIVVRLHPRLSQKERLILENELGITSSNFQTAWLIPIADLYITSVSATIRWALSCGTPVINHDVYNYQYDDFEASNALVNTVYYSDFMDNIKNLSQNVEYLDELKRKTQDEAAFWGIVDGQNVSRIRKYLSTIVL